VKRLIAVATLILLAPLPAQALTCALSGVNPIDFGTPSPLDVAHSDVSSTYTVTCDAQKSEITGAVGTTRTVNLCASYDNGTAGASGGGNRQLVNGGNNALFDVYPSAAYGPAHWGSRSGTPTGTVAQGQVVLVKTAGGGSTTAPVATTFTAHARLFGGQNQMPPATYLSTLTVSVDAFWSDVKSDCAAGGAVGSTASAGQLVSVAYQEECRVGTVSSLEFGTSGLLTSAIDAATAVSVTCTSTTPFRVGLNQGNGVGATTLVRKMTRTAAPLSTVDYGLYRDLGRSQSWGNDTATGNDTQSGTGSGTAASYPIYGRVPPQNTPEPGDYQDTVVLTVAF
jgi:spore coat protein U-like protein